ncbi:MAG TPA: DnaA N-terminal domain-containing protein [Anaerolineaceae bacterium]
MTQTLAQQPALGKSTAPDFKEAWVMADSQLRMEMPRGNYETWVSSLQPLSFNEGVFRLGAINTYAKDWVESHLHARLVKLLSGILVQPVALKIALIGSEGVDSAGVLDLPPAAAAAIPPAPASLIESAAVSEPFTDKPVKGKRKPQSGEGDADNGSPRKIQLQRAYGTERARVVQPERGMFLTMYFFNNWLRLVGHSALTTILAARSMCYWNPMTGELRNVIETDMSELAQRAEVSVRTVKAVLNDPLVKQYFLRYRIRRVMTPNGVRTAGIVLQVRMDDPLTPEDQEKHKLPEESRWYNADFEDEGEDDD